MKGKTMNLFRIFRDTRNRFMNKVQDTKKCRINSINLFPLRDRIQILLLMSSAFKRID